MTDPNRQAAESPTVAQWVVLGLATAVSSVIAVLIVRAIELAIWPEIAQFRPLDSVARAIFLTTVPALGATAVLAWLAGRREQPVTTFIRIAVVILLLSFIPDYALPFANKTLLASTATAFLHVVAAIVTVGLLIAGYRRFSSG